MKRTEEELKGALKRQLNFLDKSCNDFDAGDNSEAIRIATHLYVLLHDSGKNNRSILGQLGYLQSLKFYSFIKHKYKPGNLLTEHLLCGIRLSNSEANYFPLLDAGPTVEWYKTAFFTWWEKEVVIKDKAGRLYHRKNLICLLRDKEGGSHYDSEITEYAKTLMNGTSIGWTVSNARGENILSPGPHLASIRHIAYEFKRSLDEFLFNNKISL